MQKLNENLISSAVLNIGLDDVSLALNSFSGRQDKNRLLENRYYSRQFGSHLGNSGSGQLPCHYAFTDEVMACYAISAVPRDACVAP